MLSPDKPIKEDKMKENIEETKETQGDQKKVELDSKDSNEEKHDEKSELFDTAETSDGSTPGLSKRAKKKLLKRQAWLDSKPERKALEKLKRREKLDKRKAEDPDLPSYSESRKRIKNVYVEKIKSPINIGKGISINTILLIFWFFCLTYNLRVLPYGFCPFKSNISRPFLAYACTYCTLHCALIVLT